MNRLSRGQGVSFSQLRDELLGRLHGFMNGESLNVPSRLAHPALQFEINNLVKPLFARSYETMMKLVEQVERETACSFPGTKEYLARLPLSACRWSCSISARKYAEFLGVLHAEIGRALERLHGGVKLRPVGIMAYEQWLPKARSHDPVGRFQCLYGLHKDLAASADDFAALVLHGSCATLDTTNFSDIDFLIVLRDEVVRDPVRLVSCRRKVMRWRGRLDLFNQYNHHGFMFLTQLDLAAYSESFLPIETIRRGVLFSPGGSILLAKSELPTHWLQRKEKLLRKCVHNLTSKPRSIVELLDKIGEALLIPCLYLALRGQYLYKGDALRVIQKYLSPKGILALEHLTQARRDWPYKGLPRFSAKLLRAVLNPLLYHEVMRRLPAASALKGYVSVIKDVEELDKEYMNLVSALQSSENKRIRRGAV